MSQFTQIQIENAKQELFDYIISSSRLPGDLEDHFCPALKTDSNGFYSHSPKSPVFVDIDAGILDKWKSSVYYIALTDLVNEGKVQWRRDNVGFVWYFARCSDNESASL